MSDETEDLTLPAQPNNAWGRPITGARQRDLQPNLDRLRQGQPASESRPVFKGLPLTGAEVSWLAMNLRDPSGAVPSLDLKEARLLETHLEGARLKGAHLEWAALDRAHLESAILDGTHLEGASLRESHFESAQLVEAHLNGAIADGAHLEGANLRDAHLEGPTSMVPT